MLTPKNGHDQQTLLFQFHKRENSFNVTISTSKIKCTTEDKQKLGIEAKSCIQKSIDTYIAQHRPKTVKTKKILEPVEMKIRRSTLVTIIEQ